MTTLVTALNASFLTTTQATLIRPQTLAIFTLAAIVTWDLSSIAQATPPTALSKPTTGAVLSPGKAIAPPAIEQRIEQVAQAAPPETMSVQEFSKAAVETQPDQTTAAQYYQDYQALPQATQADGPLVPPVTEAAASQTAAPAIAPPPATRETAVSSPAVSSPAGLPETNQPASLSEPVWVIPSKPPASSPVPSVSTTPTDSTPAPAPTQPAPVQPTATPVQPATPSGVAVLATDIQVVGGTPELQQIVRNTVATKPGQQISNTQLQQDVAKILDTGLFANASVSTQPNPPGVTVVFQVEPIVVRSLQLSGAQALTPEVANQLFKPQLGVPVNPTEITQAVQRVNEWYSQNGYVLARVLAVQPTRDGILNVSVAEGVVRSVRVRFLSPEGKTVDEKGQPIRFRTQPDFVRRQIKLQPGQVFQTQAAREDLGRIASLGVFETANVSFEGDARQADVIYNVVEGKTRGFNFGAGYNDDLGLYGTVNYQDSNFGGLGQKLSANVQVGTQDTQFDARFRSPYRETEPNIPGYGAYIFRRQGLSRVFDDEIKLPNGSRVRERRIGGGINLDYPVFGPTWNNSLGLNYTNVSTRDKDGDIFKEDEEGNPLTLSGKGIDDLYSLSFTATKDRRDNPTNPGSGSVLNLSTEQFLPIGRGEVLGNRLTANYAQYIPVDLFKSAEAEQQFPEIFAFNVQGGTVIGDLPPYDAFVLGGPNSVRGWDTGDIASSRSYFLLSTEYRFPIYRFIGGVVFADFATDLGSQDSVLGDPGGDRDKPGSGFGGGVGLRVNSPIGIIRADFGISNRGDTRFQFGFGQKF